MQELMRVTAIVCVAVLSARVDSKLVRWEADRNEKHWLPARRTIDVQPLLLGMSPMPTAAPLLPPRELIDKRSAQNNTCAYISGSSDYPLYCNTDSGCVFHTSRKAFGCCPDNPKGTTDICEAWTTCLHSSERSRFTSDGVTLWCGQSAYPSCVKHTFADSSLSGYSLWGCGKTAGTGRVYNQATDRTTSSTSPKTTRTSSGSSSKPTSSDTSSSQGADATPDGSNSGQPQPQPQPQPQSSSPPIGAIVGGAVGGVAALAILGFAIFFLVRRSRKTSAGHPINQQPAVAGVGSPQVPPGGPQGPGGGAFAAAGGQQQQQQQQPYSQMAQQQPPQGPYGFAPVMNNDPRNSIAKPPYGVGVATSPYEPNGMSPPHSPSPGYPSYDTTPSPPPPAVLQAGGSPHQPYGAGWAVPQQQTPPGYHQQPSPQQQQYNAMPPPAGYPPPQGPQTYHQQPPRPGYASELPTGRGDGELRELA